MTKSKSLSAFALALLLLSMFTASLFIATPVSAQATTSDWPMFMADPQHTGVSPGTAPDSFAVQWKFPIGGPTRGSPAVVGGKVYIGSENNDFFCVDAESGTQIWKYTTGGAIHSAPAVYNGKVYFGSADYNVYCLDANSGTLIWKYTTGKFVYSSPVVVNGKVYIASNDKNIYCLNADSGALVWKYTTFGYYSKESPTVRNATSFGFYGMSPCYDAATNSIFAGSFDWNLYRLNADTGALMWYYKTGAGIYSASPSCANGIVYCGSDDNYLHAVNITTGKMIFKTQLPSPLYNFWVESTAGIYQGKIYIGMGHDIGVFNATDGTYLNKRGQMGTMQKSSQAIAAGKVFSANHDCRVYLFSEGTMDTVQSFKDIGSFDSTPAIANGKVYIASNSGHLFCLAEGARAKYLATITFTVQPHNIPLGTTLNSTGWFQNTQGMFPVGANITLTYTKPDGTTMVRNALTDGYGRFTDPYTPDAVGTYWVNATWPGDDVFEKPENVPTQFNVTEALPKTSTSINIAPASAGITSGSAITIRGTLSPAIIGEKVTVTFTKPGGGTQVDTVVTSGGGVFIDTIATAYDVGTWKVTAKYDGSSKYEASTSNEATIDVSATQQVQQSAISADMTYAVIAIVAIVVAAVLAFVLLIQRRK